MNVKTQAECRPTMTFLKKSVIEIYRIKDVWILSRQTLSQTSNCIKCLTPIQFLSFDGKKSRFFESFILTGIKCPPCLRCSFSRQLQPVLKNLRFSKHSQILTVVHFRLQHWIASNSVLGYSVSCGRRQLRGGWLGSRVRERTTGKRSPAPAFRPVV